MTARIVTGAGYQRQQLADRLPLDTPFALHMFPSHRCNLKCGYCVHSLLPEQAATAGFSKSIMDFDIFRKCIDDATRFPGRIKVLILAGWGEPLTHPKIADMVAYAHERNIADRIEIVSNGTLLTPDLSDALVAAGLDRIRISIQGLDNEKCREMAGVDVDFARLVENIRYFYTHRKNSRVFIKTVDAAVPTPGEVENFHSIFGTICDEIAIEQVIPVAQEIDHSRFGSEFSKRHCGGEAEPVKVCPFPFYMSVVNPDGSYAPCCSPDLPLELGNITLTSIVDIWQGEKLRTLRALHLVGRRGGSPVCASCLRPQYDIQHEDNVDAAAARLLPHYCTSATERTTT